MTKPAILKQAMATVAAFVITVPLSAATISYVDLHPPGASASEAYAAAGTQQAGYAIIGDYHAALWSGTAASFIDLNPTGASRSMVNGSGGSQQAGSATIGGSDHAPFGRVRPARSWTCTLSLRLGPSLMPSPVTSRPVGHN
jgi:hypothetical protein